MGGGPEPGGHVDCVGRRQLEVGHARVQVEGERIEEYLLGVLPELEDSGQDGVLAPGGPLAGGGEGGVVGRGSSGPRPPGPGVSTGQGGRAAAVPLQGAARTWGSLGRHGRGVDEAPDGAAEAEHAAVLQDRRLHGPLTVDHNLRPG